jgi:hypothetical protein
MQWRDEARNRANEFGQQLMWHDSAEQTNRRVM